MGTTTPGCRISFLIREQPSATFLSFMEYRLEYGKYMCVRKSNIGTLSSLVSHWAIKHWSYLRLHTNVMVFIPLVSNLDSIVSWVTTRKDWPANGISWEMWMNKKFVLLVWLLFLSHTLMKVFRLNKSCFTLPTNDDLINDDIEMVLNYEPSSIVNLWCKMLILSKIVIEDNHNSNFWAENHERKCNWTAFIMRFVINGKCFLLQSQ